MNPKAGSFYDSKKDNHQNCIEPDCSCTCLWSDLLAVIYVTISTINVDASRWVPLCGMNFVCLYSLGFPFYMVMIHSFIYSFNKCLTPTMHYGIFGELETWIKELFHKVILGLHWKILIIAVTLLFKFLLKLTCYYIYRYFPIDFFWGIIHIRCKSPFLSTQFIVTHYMYSWVITAQSRYGTFFSILPKFFLPFAVNLLLYHSPWQPLISFLYL